MMRRTLYEFFGIAENATSDEVKSRYRELAKRLHPDIGGDADQMVLLNRAFEVLGDTEKRRQYDIALAQYRAPRQVLVYGLSVEIGGSSTTSGNVSIFNAGNWTARAWRNR